MLKRLQNIITYERIHKNASLLWIPVALYYLRFIRRPDGMIDYPKAAQCMLDEQVLSVCASGFIYTPTFAFIMTPFAYFPMWMRNAVWYAITISAIYFGLKLCEKIVIKSFSLKLDNRELFWLRTITFLLSLKFILSVLENQAYDFLVFFFVVVGVYGLVEKKKYTASLGLSFAAALKVIPLVFFPYLFFKKKWDVLALCVIFFLFFSFIPDLFFTPKDSQSGYFINWVEDVAKPALPGNKPLTWRLGGTSNPLNQSLRSLVYRASVAANLEHLFQGMLLASFTLLLTLIFYVLLKSYKLENLYVLDASVLVIGMLMLSPMASKSHFISLILPNMAITAYLIQQKSFKNISGCLLSLSFALSTLTSKDLVGRKVGTALLNMGCVTISTLLLLAITAIIISRIQSSPSK